MFHVVIYCHFSFQERITWSKINFCYCLENTFLLWSFDLNINNYVTFTDAIDFSHDVCISVICEWIALTISKTNLILEVCGDLKVLMIMLFMPCVVFFRQWWTSSRNVTSTFFFKAFWVIYVCYSLFQLFDLGDQSQSFVFHMKTPEYRSFD